MKFISKNSNLLIVLSPGLPAQPLSGIPARSGLSVRFRSGMVEVKDEDLIEKLKAHPGFNSDFICAQEDEKDPYASFREEMEPAHHIAEIKYGHVEKRASSKRKEKIPPELEKLVNQLAMEKVKEILPSVVEMTIKKMAEAKAKEMPAVVNETPTKSKEVPAKTKTKKEE